MNIETISWWVGPPPLGWTDQCVRHFAEEAEQQPITRRVKQKFASPEESSHSGMVKSEASMKANSGIRRRGFGISERRG